MCRGISSTSSSSSVTWTDLALHKINVFHWHLTDDDGWRVEIKKYPKLTQVGAWRGPKEALPASYESGNQRYGGFYTQARYAT
jgi:hexosaminidase